MRMKKMPTVELLHDLLECRADEGRLFWRERRPDNCANCTWFNARYAGKEAFTSVTAAGYKVGLINGTHYQAHRVIWLMSEGSLPTGALIDHVNRDKADNRLENLRLSSHSKNQMNKVMRSYGGRKKSSSFKGVSFIDAPSSWQASIRIDGIKKHLGAFRSEEAAARAYDAAALEHFGEHALTNKQAGLL